jgi:hypothetical protein
MLVVNNKNNKFKHSQQFKYLHQKKRNKKKRKKKK